LFANATSRTEVVVTFLAMLELIRLKQLVAVQESAFGEIELVSVSAEATVNPAEAYAEAVTEEVTSGTGVVPAAGPQSN
jgi:segregation and condensation protein A